MNRSIVRFSREDHMRTDVDLSSIGEALPPVCTKKIRLFQAGFHVRRPSNKLFTSVKNHKVRLKWVRIYHHWTRTEWSRTICADKVEVKKFGEDGIRFDRCLKGIRQVFEYQQGTVQHGERSVSYSRNIGDLFALSALDHRNALMIKWITTFTQT